MISVKAKSETMYQDSELLKFSVDIHGEGAMKTTLDEKEQYTAQQFMESLTEGKDYTLECESDGTKRRNLSGQNKNFQMICRRN